MMMMIQSDNVVKLFAHSNNMCWRDESKKFVFIQTFIYDDFYGRIYYPLDILTQGFRSLRPDCVYLCAMGRAHDGSITALICYWPAKSYLISILVRERVSLFVLFVQDSHSIVQDTVGLSFLQRQNEHLQVILIHCSKEGSGCDDDCIPDSSYILKRSVYF